MKEKLRKDILRIRKKMSKEKALQKSKKIKKKLFKMDEYQKASSILFYVSYNNEVYTHNMIKESMEKGKNIVVPLSDKKNKELILSKLTNWEDLSRGEYGILEPAEERIEKVSADEIDLVIVPGIVFDKYGNRVGHGKGYYDRLLRQVKCPKIGLSFEKQIVKKIPEEKHDQPVDKILTEKRFIDCF